MMEISLGEGFEMDEWMDEWMDAIREGEGICKLLETLVEEEEERLKTKD